jgi:hypothetical protein
MLRWALVLLWLASLSLHGHLFSSDLEAQAATPSRIVAATELASSMYSEWLGASGSPVVIDAIPSSFDTAGSMSVEANVAFEIGRQRFAHVADVDAALADGIAWYLQSRVVERAFDLAFHVPGYRFQSTCFFGCYVRWTLPALIVTRWSDGIGRVEFLRHQSGRQWPLVDRRPAARLGQRALAIALALASLERELGWPTLQGALRVAANAQDGRPFVDVLEQATARDLKAVFAATSSPPVDYRLGPVVTSPATTCGASPCYVTRVPLIGGAAMPFPLTVLVEFDDQSQVSEPWDGNTGTFEYESGAAAARVRLDPDRRWLLDPDFANGEYVRVPRTDVRVLKWVAAWVLWLQDAMLTATFPI